MLYQCGDGGVSQIIPMEGGPNARPPPPVRGTQMEALEACKTPNFQPEQEEQDMKKRLLSAALALAMVLTMLPLSVMPASATSADKTLADADNGKFTVTYRDKDFVFKAASGNDPAITAPNNGFFYYGSVKQDDGTNKTQLVEASGGVLIGTNPKSGVWYSSLDKAIEDKKSSIVLLDSATYGVASLNNSLVSSLTIDVNGHTLGGTITIPGTYDTTNSVGATVTNKNSFSSLTIKNSTQSGSDYKPQTGVAINVGTSSAVKENGTTITLNNVQVGAITAYYTTSCTVNVNGSEAGAIALSGTSGGAVNVGTSVLSGKAASVSITTSGASTGGRVTATNATITSGVTLSGVGATLTGTNSHVNVVSLFGHDGTSLTDSQKSSLAAPSVTLNGGSATTIGSTGTEALKKPYSVTLNGNVSAIGITLDNANVTVNNSAAGAITVKNGDVKLTGSTSGPASAGNITLGDNPNPAAASLTVTGQKVTTGDLKINGGTVNVTVPNDDTNVFGTITGTINNKGISGGVWGSAVPKANLNASLVYQVKNGTGAPNAGKFVYYAGDQFQKLIDAYQLASSAEISLVKDSAVGSNTITFKNGTDVLTVIKYTDASLPMTLPTTVNGGAVSKWTEYEKDGTTLIRDLVNTAGYSTPNPVADRVLNAQVTDNAITQLVGVATSVPGLTVRLVGNVITLSGAVPQNTTEIQIQVSTDGKPGIKNAEVSIVYDASNGSVRFANQTDLGGGMWITNDWAYLVMPNDTTRYSLNGSGIKVQATNLTDKNVHGYTGDLPVIVTVNCSGTGWTNLRKAELANAMSADATAFGTTLTLAAGSKVNFKDSPAVQEALNAVVAGISESQVNSWILNAQNTAWRKQHNTTPSAADRAGTGYSEVHVVAYMAVNITNYNTANDPGTMTMTLTPSYYVEVTGDNGAKITSDYKLEPTVSAQLNALRPVNGRALGSLTGDVGKIVLTLAKENAFKTSVTPVAHQGGTYAYPSSGKNNLVFTITHAINGSLGTMIVNGDAALVNLYEDSTKKVQKGSYDTLQAAVDDAEDGWYIDVDANYKGSCAIAVTGLARKFQINTNGANRVTSNVAGVVTEKTSGTLYEVQLERDNITNAGIAVGSAANGTASVNVTSAKPGSSVSGTYKANSGYKAGSFTATAQPGNKSVSVSVSANGTFSFTVPSGATSVTVTPSFVLDNGLPFTDVANNAWYFTAVKYCYDTTNNGYRLMEGDSAATFAPNGSFTRAHMVQILWNMKGRPTPKTTANPFRDMSSSNWYYSAVLWAYENGYAKGYPDGTFKPGQAVTRQEMVQFLYQASGSPSGSGNLSYYSDGYTANNWAQPALRWATGLGILSGQNSASLGNTLAPRAVAKRCEVAVTVMNFDKLNLF